MIRQVWIIEKPVSPFPEGRSHFVQQPALGLVTEDMLPQAPASVRQLLPQSLFVSSLASDPKATMQPHEPVSDSRDRFSFPLLHTVVC